MHEQPVFQDMGLFRNERYPVAGRLVRRGLYLPNGLIIRIDQITEVAAAIRKFLA